jgi:hypothetical protein
LFNYAQEQPKTQPQGIAPTQKTFMVFPGIIIVQIKNLQKKFVYCTAKLPEKKMGNNI